MKRAPEPPRVVPHSPVEGILICAEYALSGLEPSVPWIGHWVITTNGRADVYGYVRSASEAGAISWARSKSSAVLAGLPYYSHLGSDQSAVRVRLGSLRRGQREHLISQCIATARAEGRGSARHERSATRLAGLALALGFGDLVSALSEIGRYWVAAEDLRRKIDREATRRRRAHVALGAARR